MPGFFTFLSGVDVEDEWTRSGGRVEDICLIWSITELQVR